MYHRHLAVYDGNQREWTRSKTQTEHEQYIWPVMDHLCSLNKSNYDCPIGPVKYLSDFKYTALWCTWTMGQEDWLFIIIVSGASLDEIETAEIIAKLGVDLGDDEE
jgi:hypothetical protein